MVDPSQHESGMKWIGWSHNPSKDVDYAMKLGTIDVVVLINHNKIMKMMNLLLGDMYCGDVSDVNFMLMMCYISQLIISFS